MDKAFIKNPVEAYEKLKEENKKFKDENESLKISLKMVAHTLEYTLQNEVGLYKRQIDNSVPDDWEYEEVLVLIEEYIEKLKAENQILKDEFEILQNNFDSSNREWEEHTEGLIQVLTEIKEIAKKQMKICSCKFDLDNYESGCRGCASKDARVISKQILQKISEVEDVSSGS